MHLPFRWPLLTGMLLLASVPFARAESPMPDPIPPAVVGRPLAQTWTLRPARPKPLTVKPAKPRAAAKPVVSTKAMGAAAATAPTAHRAKAALDDRADPNLLVDDVGKGTHVARKPLGPGVYFGDRHRSAVRKYYAEHPLAESAVHWQIGEPVPSGAKVTAVPAGLLASLPKLPPGHRYMELGGEVVLVASGSNMVVDGISRSGR